MSALSNEDDLLAAELALGLIDEAERASAEARLAHDADFAAAHARWQDYAAAFFADAGEAPRPSLWSSIEARLPANDAARAPVQPGLRWWQAGTAVAGMAAIALGVIVTRQAAPVAPPAAVTQPVEAPLVAVLTGKQGVVTVSFDRASARLTVAPSAIEIGDHSAELWVIPSDGKPRSLGVIATAAPGWRPAPTQAARAVAPGVTLAISIEPIGGSRTGQPTGPVILTGKVAPA